MENTRELVFIVVGVGRDFSGPTVWHPTEEMATDEAKRLAKNFPNKNFLVCHVVKNVAVKEVNEMPLRDGLHEAPDFI